MFSLIEQSQILQKEAVFSYLVRRITDRCIISVKSAFT